MFDLEVLEFHCVRGLLLERLATPLGRPAVDELAPFEDPESANEALAIAERLGALADGQWPPLSGVVEVRTWLGSFFAGRHSLSTRDLADLKRVLRAAWRCREWAARQLEDSPLHRLHRRFPRVADLVGELDLVVDERGEIQDSASARLAEVRREIAAAEQAVSSAVNSFLMAGGPELRRALQTGEPTWRHGRPVFQVRAEQRQRVPGVLHDRSQSGATLFIEPAAVVDAGNRLADAQAAEQREIQVVLAEVGRRLGRYRKDIQKSVQRLAELDLHVARGRLIRDGFVAARVVPDGPLVLEDARHPMLQDSMDPARVVPLKMTLGEPHHMLVVTGPNTGGKTVVLKTVGLLCLMGLCGVPIPAAEGSQVPFLTAITADIGDEQGISQNLSTFSSHVQRIARCLGAAGTRSLVLLDELGAGTDPEEGSALGYSVLESLVANRTLAVVSTHLGRLKDFAYRHEGAQNGSMAFDGKSLQPLYRLEVGIPGASHALDIAGRVGMPDDVVVRARELLGTRDERLQEMIDQVTQARQQAEADRQNTRKLTQQAARQTEQLDEKLQEAERRDAWLEEEAAVLLDEEFQKAKAAMEPHMKALAQAPGQHGERAREAAAELESVWANATVHRRRMRFIGGLKKGHTVYLPRFHKLALVRKVDRVRERLTVEYGRMKIDVSFEDVSWLQPLGELGRG